MKHDVQLRSFITFILLAAIPKNRSAVVSDLTHVQPATPRLLPLTEFLAMALERARIHNFPQANRLAEASLKFRLGTW